MLGEESSSLSSLAKRVTRYYRIRETNLRVDNPHKIIAALKNSFPDASHIKVFDGLNVEYDDFWFNIRPSNTEPLLRIMIEGKSKSLVTRKLREIIRIINTYASKKQ